MLNKKNRISNRGLIKKLSDKGNTYRSRLFIFKFLPGKNNESEFAITISKKVSKKAVERNKLKRQINEAIKSNLENLKNNIVVLIIAKTNSLASTYQDIETNIIDFINQVNSHVE